MQTKKMSLANIQGKLSRAEMKKIMAGSDGSCGSNCDQTCTLTNGRSGKCHVSAYNGNCYCVGALT